MVKEVEVTLKEVEMMVKEAEMMVKEVEMVVKEVAEEKRVEVSNGIKQRQGRPAAKVKVEEEEEEELKRQVATPERLRVKKTRLASLSSLLLISQESQQEEEELKRQVAAAG